MAMQSAIALLRGLFSKRQHRRQAVILCLLIATDVPTTQSENLARHQTDASPSAPSFSTPISALFHARITWSVFCNELHP
jgi:hypothetical protein